LQSVLKEKKKEGAETQKKLERLKEDCDRLQKQDPEQKIRELQVVSEPLKSNTYGVKTL
jgi:hypothetical protein